MNDKGIITSAVCLLLTLHKDALLKIALHLSHFLLPLIFLLRARLNYLRFYCLALSDLVSKILFFLRAAGVTKGVMCAAPPLHIFADSFGKASAT